MFVFWSIFKIFFIWEEKKKNTKLFRLQKLKILTLKCMQTKLSFGSLTNYN